MSTHKPDTANQAGPTPAAKVAPGKPKPVMLLVLGPHRSGTSLTARMLECLGGVNSKNLNPANEFNPKGYFEDWDTYQFNEYVLMPELRTSWHATSPIRWDSLAPSRYEQLQTSALEIIRRNYDRQAPLSILKEPRIAHLLPFWLKVLQRAGFSVKAVCPVRDPLSVARSLAHRDDFPLATGFLLYFRAWEAVLTNLGKTPAVFFDFQDIFNCTASALKKVAEHLRLSVPEDFDARLDIFTTSHLDSTLVHSTVLQEDYDQLDKELPSSVTRLHPSLLKCCTTQDTSEARRYCLEAAPGLDKEIFYLSALDQFAQRQVKQTLASSQLASDKAALQLSLTSVEQQRATLQSSLASAEEARAQLASDKAALQLSLTSVEQQRATLQSSLASAEEARAQLAASHEATINERDALQEKVQERFAELATLAGRIAGLDEELLAKRTHIRQLEAHLSGARERIDSLLASTSWRVTRPLRAIKELRKATAKNS